MLDTDVPVPPSDDAVSQAEASSQAAEVATPPRRRRAASRPAGPPAAIPAAEPLPELIPAPPVAELGNAEPESVEAEVVALVEEAPAEPVAPPAPARAPRKRASRPAGPPVEAPAGPAEPLATTAETESVAQPDAEFVPEPPAVPEAQPEPEEQPAPPTPRTTRRRKAASAEGDDGGVAASLAALEESRPRRTTRRRSSAGEASSDAVASALDSLAAAIAAGVHPGAEERPVEEPAAEAETAEEPIVAEPLEGRPEEAEEAAEAEETEAEEAEAEEQSEDELSDEEAAEDEESGDEGAEDEATEDEGETEASDAGRRRRRRRGGRRRRRGASDRGADEDEEATDETEEGEPGEPEASAPEGETGEAAAEGTSRRRRRRRRRGEDAGDEAAEDGVDVVVRVREPRRTRSGESSDQITGIEGSTRMEAKKQRRREGRAAGRRRAPILSEAEFLARRESVERRMVIRQREDYTQIGVLEDGILVEHYVDRDSSASMIGNIYLGRVQNVLPSMEAAFIDIGRGRNAVLYAGEVDWEFFGVTGSDRKVEKVLKSGQAVLVQVTKDPVGAKGARLTSHISIPGRYVVYSPGGQLSGISRKLPENERARLKHILDELVGENASVIVRTAAEGASEEELVRDVNRLKAQWEVIEKKVAQGNSPQLLYSEPDLTVRIVRDLFTEDFSELVVDGTGQGEDAYDTVQAYVTHVAPHLQERLVKWNRWTQGDLFEHYRVDEQVAKALERKVHLPSGGSLIIDRTEAMTVIDVNTGKFTGTQGNLEATVTSNNLEAAEEIVRQLRLRDIGGIIVIDFIDMVLPANRELLLRRLVECLGRDRTRHQVAEVTSLGLVQMTRKKIGTGLAEAFSVPCETCKGRGYHIHDAPVNSQAPADGGEREHYHGPRRPRAQSSGKNSSD